ncbi:aldo/keto reductase [Gluconacetobacter asukensis]|uniref:Aldo/keto reductase n=1 Tax=Gluconacetobacter asukensis TaxID=1017181 RepID=A0A7W4IWY8_9PROT|nr:aldo/keto reductase [Gluconacetobacter asukensis]MBB2170569.1 aldo/keto reductase [Gluconacetobacter asukensis]
MVRYSPTIRLNSGLDLPALGFGVYRAAPEETVGAVRTALTAGYRMVDTAAAYFNEAEVGQAIRESGLPRNEIIVQTKAWITDYGTREIRHAYDRSRRKLGLDRIDVYLLHQPATRDFTPMIAAWRELEKMLWNGEVGSIGVCNFSPDHLRRLVAATDIPPALNQVELHPFFTQSALRAYDRTSGIVTQAWSPIGGVMRYWGDDRPPEDNPLTHPTIMAIGRKYDRTPAQVILRWQLDIGNSAIPKSTHPDRIRENFAVFDFTLTADDIAAIETLDRGRRGGPDPDHLPDAFYNRTIPD